MTTAPWVMVYASFFSLDSPNTLYTKWLIRAVSVTKILAKICSFWWNMKMVNLILDYFYLIPFWWGGSETERLCWSLFKIYEINVQMFKSYYSYCKECKSSPVSFWQKFHIYFTGNQNIDFTWTKWCWGKKFDVSVSGVRLRWETLCYVRL